MVLGEGKPYGGGVCETLFKWKKAGIRVRGENQFQPVPISGKVLDADAGHSQCLRTKDISFAEDS